MENSPTGTLWGVFSATDEDTDDSHTFSFANGFGSTDNGGFLIEDGNKLVTNISLDYETKSTYTIRVAGTDAARLEHAFVLNVLDENGESNERSLAINIIPEGGGTVNGAGFHGHGQTVAANATPAEGFIFAGWTGDVPGGENVGAPTINIPMFTNKTLNAYFTKAYHDVVVKVFPERHGYVKGGGTFHHGTEITLSALELEGDAKVAFSHWRVNEVDQFQNNTPDFNLVVDRDYIVEAVFDMGLGDDFVLVPAHTYTREYRRRYEHECTVGAFYIRKYETTKAQWYEVYNWAVENGYEFEFDPVNENGYNLRHSSPKYFDDYPITGIYWNDMLKWCNALSEKQGRTPSYYNDTNHTQVHKTAMFETEEDYLGNQHVKWTNRAFRLPTEAEWEAAARGSLQNMNYPQGPPWAWSYYDQPITELPITYATQHNRKPNGFGIYDMAGNGWESVWDWSSNVWYANPLSREPDTPGFELSETQMRKNYKNIRGGSGHSSRT